MSVMSTVVTVVCSILLACALGTNVTIEELTQTVEALQTKVDLLSAGEMHGSGTSNPSKLHWNYMSLFLARLKLPTHMTYRAVGSSTGKEEFAAGVNDFGCSEIPLLDEDRNAISSTLGVNDKVIHFPFVIGAIGVFYNIPSSALGVDLKLTGPILARIFTRDIKFWDHKDIIALNPEFSFPADSQEIQVVHRGKGSSSTYLFTQYLDQFDEWTLEQGAVVSNWPVDTFTREGSSGISGFIKETEWSIGYVDSGHGHDKGLSELKLKNANGEYLSSKEADIAAAAKNVNFPASDGDWSEVDLVNLPGANIWPMTTFSYILVREDLSSIGERGALVKAYLEFINSEEGQELVEEYSFVPVPDNVIQLNTAGIESLILAAGVKQFTVEEATQPIDGAGELVISKKRKDYAHVKIDKLTSDQEKLSSRIDDMNDQENKPINDQKNDEKASSDGVATAGLILALLSLVLHAVMFFASRSGRGDTKLPTTELADNTAV